MAGAAGHRPRLDTGTVQHRRLAVLVRLLLLGSAERAEHVALALPSLPLVREAIRRGILYRAD